MSDAEKILTRFKDEFRAPGQITWIGLRPEKRGPVQSVQAVMADPSLGLVGDHYSGASGARHVTLIDADHLPVIGAHLGLGPIEPGLLRRNIAVRGLNLLALKEQRFRVGSALVEYTGLCHPCARMEALLGPGGWNAMRGHGGIHGRVLEGGVIRVGDAVTPVTPQPA